MASDIVIQVEQLGKAYTLQSGRPERYRALRDVLARSAGSLFSGRGHPAASEPFWAIKDVSFEVRRGEVLGIIGRNGAGKSTLLKILSRITAPTTGRVTLHGRVGSLLEVGTGFHPELTGRENVFLSGAILGMSRREVSRKFDEIVAFAGVEPFVDMPVKRYSSGMYVRLGFAVAAHLEPEILLVDEVLAVGDAEFQRKCLGKMDEVAGAGRTVIFVSHNMGAILKTCNTALFLDGGRLITRGTPQKIIGDYLASVQQGTARDLDSLHRKGNGKTRLVSVRAFSDAQDEDSPVYSGGPLCIKLEYDRIGYHPGENIRIDVRINSVQGWRMAWMSTSLKPEPKDVGKVITFRVPRCPLQHGLYSLTVCAYVNGEEADWIDEVLSFEVLEGDYYQTGRKIPENQGAFLLDFDILW